MKTGTSSSRSTVKALAMLSSGARSGCAAPSGAVEEFIESSLIVHALTPPEKPRNVFEKHRGRTPPPAPGTIHRTQHTTGDLSPSAVFRGNAAILPDIHREATGRTHFIKVWFLRS